MGGVSGSCIADAAMQARMLGDGDAQARLRQGLRGGRAVLRLAADADHPARHRLHPLRLGRAGLDRPPVRRRHSCPRFLLWLALAIAISRHRAAPRLRARAHDAADAAAARSARALSGRHLGDPVPDLPDRRPAHRASSRRPRSAPSRWSTRSSIGVFVYRKLRGATFREALEGSLVRRRLGDVPDRAVGHLRLRHRVRTRARGDLRGHPGDHRRAAPGDGADRRADRCSRAASSTARC